MPVPTATQRQISPIPPGRYWLDVVGELAIKEFSDWVRDMAGAVLVEAVEEDAPPAISTSKVPRLAFVIFVVPPGRAPFLDGGRFGFPNFAPPEVRSSQDVFRAPVTKTPLDDGLGPFIKENLPELGAGIGILLLLVALAALGNSK